MCTSMYVPVTRQLSVVIAFQANSQIMDIDEVPMCLNITYRYLPFPDISNFIGFQFHIGCYEFIMTSHVRMIR